jgi:hypothetical protein
MATAKKKKVAGEVLVPGKENFSVIHFQMSKLSK